MHWQQDFGGAEAQRLLEGGDVVDQGPGGAVADVEDSVRRLAAGGVGGGWFVEHSQQAFGDVVDVGEITHDAALVGLAGEHPPW